MGNFSIVFKNSLQNKKKHPASSCIATRDRVFRRYYRSMMGAPLSQKLKTQFWQVPES